MSTTMDQDKFALVEKIIKDIENIMSKNAELCAFDIVPVDVNFQNKSPVLHLENCLGLESWCVKHVYMCCYTELMDKYFSKTKRKSLKVSSVNAERLSKLLNVTLLLNPELSTFWNKRREMVNKNLLEKSAELRFTNLVLSRKPKCNDAFSYRRWLLDIIFQEDNLQTNYLDDLINTELNICKLSCDKMPNNYHSWSHRMWLLQKLKSYTYLNLPLLYIQEYDFSLQWTQRHVSDYSCFHYRQFCIRNIFTIDNEAHWKIFEDTVNVNHRKTFARFLSAHFPEDTMVESEDSFLTYTDDNLLKLLLGNTHMYSCCPQSNFSSFSICRRLEVVFQELVSNSELIKFYKHHETLWYHRRFIVNEFVALLYEYFHVHKWNGRLLYSECPKCHTREQQNKIVRYDVNRLYNTKIFNVFLSHEQGFMEERKSDDDNYANRYEKYLRYVQGFNLLF